MSDDELERKMEFIIDQQAQSTAKIGVLEDLVTRLGNATLKRVEDLDDKMNLLVDSQIRLTEAQERNDRRHDNVDGKINALVDSQIKLAEAQERNDRRHDNVDGKINALVDSQTRLTESQALTDEKLRSLIDHVDRYLSGNGRSGNQ